MNWAAGLFRLWLLFAIALAIGLVVWEKDEVSAEFVKHDRYERSTDNLIPMPCKDARGTLGRDFISTGETCFYDYARLRRTFPEVAGLSDDQINMKYFPGSGIPTPNSEPQPWAMVEDLIVKYLAVIAIAFGVGCAVLWAFAGFRKPASN